MKKLKILCVHSFLDRVVGGAEIAFINIIRLLKEKGYDVDLLVLGINIDLFRQLVKQGIGVHCLKFKEKTFGYFNFLFPVINKIRVAFLYHRFVRSNEKVYDFIFVHHYLYSPLIFPFLKTPNLYFCHEPPRQYYEPRPNSYRFGLTRPFNVVVRLLDKSWDRYCARCADLVISNSDYTREYIYHVYGVFAKADTLGVDLEFFKPLSLKKERLIVSAGVLYPSKGHHFIMESLRLISKSKRPRLVIIGDWPRENKTDLYDLAKKLDIDLEIIDDIVSYAFRERLVTLYNRASITCVASVMEPFGLVAVESMACGTPVVAVREAGLRETVTDQTGILVDRDEKEFAKAVEYLLDKPDLIEKMGEAGRKRVEKYFTWEKTVEKIEECIKKGVYSQSA